MWPKSRPPISAYRPIRDAEQQHDENNQPETSSLWPKAPIPNDKLLGGSNALKREHLLGGDNKINQSLLLGGSKPLAEHLLLRPRLPDSEDERREENALEDDHDDFEHLDYLEPTDDMSLTSGRRFRQRLLRISFRNAIIAATFVVLLVCLVTVVVAVGGQEHLLGPGDYRKRASIAQPNDT